MGAPIRSLYATVLSAASFGAKQDFFIPLPIRVKQRTIHDRRLLARQDLILVFDLADIEVVAQHVVQRATPERDPTPRRPRGEPPGFGPDVAFSEVPQQFVDAAKFEISPED